MSENALLGDVRFARTPRSLVAVLTEATSPGGVWLACEAGAVRRLLAVVAGALLQLADLASRVVAAAALLLATGAVLFLGLLRRGPLALVAALVATGFVVALVFFFFVPTQLVPNERIESRTGERLKQEEQRLKARHDARMAGIQFVGVLAVIVGGALTWRTVWLTREAQFTERYASAIKDLGSTESPTRLGAVYALERLARDSRRDYWPIMELLLEFLRNHAGPAPQPPVERQAVQVKPEVAAVANVLRRRNAHWEQEHQQLDLSGLDLRTVVLTGADLRGANLSESDLSGAFLENADLEGAVLAKVWLEASHLEDTSFRRADLTRADLRLARLIRTDFSRAQTRDTIFKPLGVVEDVRGLRPEQLG